MNLPLGILAEPLVDGEELFQGSVRVVIGVVVKPSSGLAPGSWRRRIGKLPPLSGLPLQARIQTDVRRIWCSRSRKSGSDITRYTSPQSWGPDTPGTHSEHVSPGRMGHLGSRCVLALAIWIPLKQRWFFWRLECGRQHRLLDLGLPEHLSYVA